MPSKPAWPDTQRSFIPTCNRAPAMLLLAVLLAAACDHSARDLHRDFHAFGTVVSLSLYRVEPETAEQAVAELRTLYAELGNDWYPWWPGELQRINEALARGQPVEVSARLAELIRLAARFEALSDGRFNAGVARLSEIWGLQPLPKELDAPPDPEALAALLETRPGLHALKWDGDTMSSDDSTVMIDLGGIAKGKILEQSAALLREHGIGNAIVNIGGDLLVIGSVSGRAAQIGIRSPFRDTPIAGLTIADSEAVVTSGNYERFTVIDGKRYTHVFDPATGYPITHTAAVTVIDEDPVRADAAATALLVGGAGEFDALVAALSLEYALLIEASGDTRLTPGMAKRLHWVEQEL